MQIIKPSVELFHSTPNPEQVIERAGRICWKSEDRITEDSHVAFINMIKSKNHASVLEHASAGFIVTTDRGISHEIVRHRLCAYSQVSTRYCNYGKDKFGGEISVIKPVDLTEGSSEYLDWMYACQVAEDSYLEMLRRGAKPQTARAVLPTCLATEIAWTANFREWLHICDLRGSAAAHPDIRVVINQIKPLLVALAPTVFDSLTSK